MDQSPKKQKYKKPVLKVYGKLKALTLSGSPGSDESAGTTTKFPSGTSSSLIRKRSSDQSSDQSD